MMVAFQRENEIEQKKVCIPLREGAVVRFRDRLKEEVDIAIPESEA